MNFRKLNWWRCFVALALPAWLSGQSPAESRHPLAEVNTFWPETRPLVSLDGKVLYFSRSGYPANMGKADEADIWMCYLSADSLTTSPVNVGAPINSVFPDYPISIGISGTSLQVMRMEELPGFFDIGGGSRHREVKELPTLALFYPDASDYFVSANQQLLFFSMESPDGVGGKDIYMARRDTGGVWGKAKNMGSPINTRGNETAPFLAADGKTLYFSSDGRGGFGGKDIFVSFSMSDEHWNEWTIPQNLGPGINAGTDELYPTLAAAGEQLFFAVQTAKSDSSDIFRAPLPRIFRPQATVWMNAPNHANLSINRTDPGLAFLPEVYVTQEKTAEGYQLILPTGVNIEVVSWEEGHFWCTHTLELGYESPKSLDQDTSFTRGLADHPDYANREAIIRNIHEIGLEQGLLVDSLLLTQKKLLEGIRQKVLQMSLSSPNPSLEANRIVLMLSALPDTFVQQVQVSLNEKLQELSYKDTLSTPTTQPPVPSPEEEKLKLQLLVVDLKTYIDHHNRQLLLEQEQKNLREELEEKIAAQVAMEKQFARKPREERTAPELREDVQKMERITLDCSRIPLRPGSIRVVQNIYFEENTAVLKSYAENELQRLIEFLKKNATIAVEISAYTHTQLGHSFADLISTQRAAAVVDYLVEHGIDRNRLVAVGYGKKSPLSLPDIYPAEQKINQRIEIRILN